MAIRDTFRRAVGSRKSAASSSCSSSTHETASNPDTDNSSSPIENKTRTRTFTFRSNKSTDEKASQAQKPKAPKKKRWQKPDPREKPFTEMNLRYQQMLGSYEMTFGTSHPEQLWNPDGELSPGTSRQNSIDFGPRD